MTEADLIAERDALLGIAQGLSPREMRASADPRVRIRASHVVSDRVHRGGWDRERAETTPTGQKRGPKGRNERRGETT